MKQVLLKKWSVIIENVAAPMCANDWVLVQVFHSVISAWTEWTSLKNSWKTPISLARENPDQVAKVLKMVKDKWIKETYEFVSNTLKNMYDYGMPTWYSLAWKVIAVWENITEFKTWDIVACAWAGIANHAEVVAVPKNLCIKVPTWLDTRDACSVTLWSIAMQWVRQSEPQFGHIVVVVWLGLLWIIAVQILKAAGCYVIGSDFDQSRIDLAKKLWLDVWVNWAKENLEKIVNDYTNWLWADSTLIAAATPSSEPVRQAMFFTRKKWKVVILWAVWMELHRSPMYEKEIDLRISCSYGPWRYDPEYELKWKDYPYAYVRWTEKRNMEEYLKMLRAWKVSFSEMVEKFYNLEEAEIAYKELTREGQKPMTLVLEYDTSKKIEELIENKLQINKKELNKEIANVWVVGAWSFVKAVHLPNIKKLNKYFNLYNVSNRTGTESLKTAKQFNADFSTTDYTKIITDKETDLVIIGTRHDSHAKLVIESLKNNKAVFVEKPLAMNMEELNQIKEVIKKNNSPLLTWFNRRFSPDSQFIKEKIKNRANPIQVYYRMNAGFIPLDHWVHGSEWGWRIIWEWCHIFDLFNYWTGSDFKEVKTTKMTPKSSSLSSSDNMTVTVEYKDGSVCTLIYTSNGSNKQDKEYAEVFCDGKSYILDDYKWVISYWDDSYKKHKQDKGHFDEFKIYWEYLTDKENKELPISLEDQFNATKISILAAK